MQQRAPPPAAKVGIGDRPAGGHVIEASDDDDEEVDDQSESSEEDEENVQRNMEG